MLTYRLPLRQTEGGVVNITLRVGWKDKRVEDHQVHYESTPMYRSADLPFVPRAGDYVELWDGDGGYRQVEEVVVPTLGGAVMLKCEDYPAWVNPEAASEARVAAKEAGWTEDPPGTQSKGSR